MVAICGAFLPSSVSAQAPPALEPPSVPTYTAPSADLNPPAGSADAPAFVDPTIPQYSALPPRDDRQVQPTTEGPLHEAFLSPSKDREPSYVDKAPPNAINERPGVDPPSEKSVWIPGYWEWNGGKSDYVWTTGTWRNPPPGRFWVNGYWKREDKGWYRVPGFWSDRQTDRIDWRKEGPPADRPEDEPGPAPGTDFFYIPGHHAPDGNGVVWKKGFWAKAQTGWSWVPAQWVRQPEGWAYQEGFWDRTLEDRGTLFAPAQVNATAQAGNPDYQPLSQVAPEQYGQLYGALGRPNSNYDGYPGYYYDNSGRYYGYANYGNLGSYYGYLDYPYTSGYGYPYLAQPVAYGGYGYGGNSYYGLGYGGGYGGYGGGYGGYGGFGGGYGGFGGGYGGYGGYGGFGGGYGGYGGFGGYYGSGLGYYPGYYGGSGFGLGLGFGGFGLGLGFGGFGSSYYGYGLGYYPGYYGGYGYGRGGYGNGYGRGYNNGYRNGVNYGQHHLYTNAPNRSLGNPARGGTGFNSQLTGARGIQTSTLARQTGGLGTANRSNLGRTGAMAPASSHPFANPFRGNTAASTTNRGVGAGNSHWNPGFNGVQHNNVSHTVARPSFASSVSGANGLNRGTNGFNAAGVRSGGGIANPGMTGGFGNVGANRVGSTANVGARPGGGFTGPSTAHLGGGGFTAPRVGGGGGGGGGGGFAAPRVGGGGGGFAAPAGGGFAGGAPRMGGGFSGGAAPHVGGYSGGHVGGYSGGHVGGSSGGHSGGFSGGHSGGFSGGHAGGGGGGHMGGGGGHSGGGGGGHR